MEELAKDFGDIDDEIAILSADLTMSWQWVRVIRRVQEADRHNDALDWVERALVKFVSAPGLAELAIEEYYRAGLTDKIVPLVWDEYTAQPTGQGYRRLADHAARVGVWEDWHDRALAALRRWVDHCRSVPSGDPSFLRTPEGQRYLPHASGAHLVSAYLYDGDVESAWVEAQADDVSDEVRLDVALQRQAERRADAIPILQRIVRRDASLGGNDAYARAIEGMRRVRDLMVETGVSDDFAPYLASVRETFQRKRNLMALIDREGW
jgi:hypothetical protein